jgi:glutaminyl-tRNA synthetase
MGKAYVDSIDEERMRELRGTVTSPGKRSEFARRSAEENIELFERMRDGEFEAGEHILRAKIDMSSPNMKLRDPLLYRIVKGANHYRTGSKWAIYPMYDFAHPLSDYIEGITHSFCTLEFENNRDIYNWLIDTLRLEPPRPHQYEFARLNINYTVMSKRKLLELVQKELVSGWDDPRMPTIAGLRRRGYTPESILNFCESIGIAKANSVVDVAQLEFSIRDDLNKKTPRVMCVMDPLKVTIVNYDGSEEIDAPYYPSDVPKEGSRKLPFSRDIYIERDDFMENPPKGYYRLTPEQPVRLKHAYIISCKEIVKDDNGDIIELKVEYHPDSRSGSDTSGIKVKSAIQWVDAHTSRRVQLRLYDRLFRDESPEGLDDINPESLKIVDDALVEPSVVLQKPDVRFQFERQGYFYADPVDYTDEEPVFNKIVALKDSWNKSKNTAKPVSIQEPKKVQIDGEAAPMSAAEEALFEKYTVEYGLNNEVSNTIARDKHLSRFYSEAIRILHSPVTIANIISNEVARDMKNKTVDELKYTPQHIAQLSQMIDEEKISSKIAKQVFEQMSQSAAEPIRIVEEKGLIQISDPSEIMPVIDDVISQNPDNVEKFRAGNTRLLGFFVGQVLKATSGKANPKVVNELVAKKLDSL